MITIYALKDPISNEVRYIGKTKNIKRRFKQHLYNCGKLKTHLSNWLEKLKLNKQKPIIETLEEVDDSIWQEREIFWINFYKEKGCKLCNHTIGGEGRKGERFPEETKRKMSEAKKGYIPNIEGIKKWNESIKGTTLSEEVKQNMRNGWKNSINNSGSKHYKSYLDEEKVLEIKKLLLSKKVSEISKLLNIPLALLYKIKEGKNWKHVKLTENDKN